MEKIKIKDKDFEPLDIIARRSCFVQISLYDVVHQFLSRFEHVTLWHMMMMMMMMMMMYFRSGSRDCCCNRKSSGWRNEPIL